MRWKKIVGGIAVVLLLAVAFWYGGNTPDSKGLPETQTAVEQTSGEMDEAADTSSDTRTAESDQTKHVAKNEAKSGNIFQQLIMKITHKSSSNSSKKGQSSKKAQRNAEKAVKQAEKQASDTAKKKSTKQKTTTESRNSSNTNSQDSNQINDNNTESKSSNTNENPKTTEAVTTTEAATETPANMVRCTISISCSTVLDQMKLLKDNKKKIIPKDGIFLGNTTVTVKKGSSVFDVLQKVTKENKIQLEYNYTPAYKNYYIEGIGNLYEFDAGELSGWMYCVNGEFPGYGCSSYTVKDGDEILWVYTCNLGKDVGGYFEE